jgi:heme/copper-type cytochrome/quinol oxidase subunit 2
MSPDLLAALSEGQRAIAHVVALLVLLVIGGLVFVVRRARRRDETRDELRSPGGER